MKATVSAGFLFLGSILAIYLGDLNADTTLGSTFLVLGGLSAVVLTCELIAACYREVVELIAGLRRPGQSAPEDNIKEDHDDDRSE